MADDEHPALFRMPTVFGPYPGPRQRPGGGRWEHADGATTTSLALRFRTDRDALAALVPARLRLDDPSLAVVLSELRGLPWLAGRGYNMAVVSAPVRFEGDEELVGDFELVTWENRTEPILSGRDELGFNKVFGEVSAVEVSSDGAGARAHVGWEGREFLRIEATGLHDAPPRSRRPLLHHHYVPAVGAWGAAAIDEITATGFAPSPDPKVVEHKRGTGSATFIAGTFDELPTLAHIVAPLAELPCLEVLEATLTRSTGHHDLSDARALR